MNFLLEKGASLEGEVEGNNIFHLIAQKATEEGTNTVIASLKDHTEDISFLANQPNNEGLTPLLLATNKFITWDPPHRGYGYQWQNSNKNNSKSDEQLRKEMVENFKLFFKKLISSVKLDVNCITQKTRAALEKEKIELEREKAKDDNLPEEKKEQVEKKRKSKSKSGKRTHHRGKGGKGLKYFSFKKREESSEEEDEEVDESEEVVVDNEENDEETKREKAFQKECAKYHNSKANYSALHFLAESSNIQYLEAISEISELLVQNGLNPNLENAYQRTAFFQAVEMQNKKLIQLLLNHKVKIDTVDRKSNTPFLSAVTKNDLDTANQLLKLGADVNANNNSQNAPIHIAISNSSEAMLKLLVENKANINAKDGLGRTP